MSTLRHDVSARPRAETADRRLERIQREHELDEALKAARHLQARLEMLGDRADEVAWVRALRDELASDDTR